MAKKIDLAEGLTHFKAKENASIAITEATSTASAPHKAGEYFYYKGDLVIATADIAQGGTITLNTNCKKQPLSDSVCELKTALNDAFNLSNFEFEWGNIYNGSINTDHDRIHTVEMLWLPKGTKIKSTASYDNFNVGRYNLNGSFAANGTWGTEYVAPVDCYGRIVLRKLSGNIAESEFESLISTLSITYSTTAETILYNSTAANTVKTEVTETLRNEYGILDLHDTDNVVIANLFDKTDSDVTTNGYYDRTNAFVSSSTLGTTGYIRVLQGYQYYTNLNAGYFVLWYDADKNYLNYSNVSGANVKFSVPTTAIYMRCLFITAGIDSYVIKCDSISAIKAVNSPYADKEGVAFGTSLTYRASTTGGYLQYLPSLSNATISNQGIGNAVVLDIDSESNPDMLAAIKAYTGYATADFVLIEGFVNDWYNSAASLGTWKDTTETTVCGCVRSAINYILSQNASTTVILITDPYGQNSGGVDCSSLATKSNLTQKEFYDEIAKVAESLGIPVIPLGEISGMCENTPYYYIDNIHPTAEGAEQTANVIWSVMKNIPLRVIDAS